MGSRVGISSIAQTVSALEDIRHKNEFRYKSHPDPEVRIVLRQDRRIHDLEDSVRRNESKRAETSQVLKAVGSSAGELLCPLHLDCHVLTALVRTQILTRSASSGAALCGASAAAEPPNRCSWAPATVPCSSCRR